MILDVDGFDGGVGVKQLGDEEMIPSGGDVHHFRGSEGVLITRQNANDQLQFRIQIENA